MSAHVAPARFVLTALHRQDPAIPPVLAGPDPSAGATVCGLQMLLGELWQSVEPREGDRFCQGCESPDAAPAADIQEALL